MWDPQRLTAHRVTGIALLYLLLLLLISVSQSRYCIWTFRIVASSQLNSLKRVSHHVTVSCRRKLTVWKLVQLHLYSPIWLQSFIVVIQQWHFVLLCGVQNIESVGSCNLGLQFFVLKFLTLSIPTGVTYICNSHFVSTERVLRFAKMLTIKPSTSAKFKVRESYDFATIGSY
jgi:hypothetical protein